MALKSLRKSAFDVLNGKTIDGRSITFSSGPVRKSSMPPRCSSPRILSLLPPRVISDRPKSCCAQRQRAFLLRTIRAFDYSGNGNALGYALELQRERQRVGFGGQSRRSRACRSLQYHAPRSAKNAEARRRHRGRRRGHPGRASPQFPQPVAATASVRGKDTDTDVADAVKEKKRSWRR